MYFRIVVLLLYIFISFNSYSQSLTGKVIGIADSVSEPLPYASVHWINTSVGTTADSSGNFSIKTEGISDKGLVVNIMGYLGDTIHVGDETFITVKLNTDIATMEEILIKLKPKGFNDPIKTEVIGHDELVKAACCDLAGCFETQANVQPMTTNIVTNSK